MREIRQICGLTLLVATLLGVASWFIGYADTTYVSHELMFTVVFALGALGTICGAGTVIGSIQAERGTTIMSDVLFFTAFVGFVVVLFAVGASFASYGKDGVVIMWAATGAFLAGQVVNELVIVGLLADDSWLRNTTDSGVTDITVHRAS